MTAPTERHQALAAAEGRLTDQLAGILRPIMDEKLGPSFDALRALRTAVADSDDAAVGRRTRAIMAKLDEGEDR